MQMKGLYVGTVGSHAPLYYFNIGMIKRIDKKIWLNIPKHDNYAFKRLRLMHLKTFKSALLKFAQGRL
jgi:hypothetical protein